MSEWLNLLDVGVVVLYVVSGVVRVSEVKMNLCLLRLRGILGIVLIELKL